MSPVQHVVLVPGFFGFGRLGDLRYFAGVGEALASEFARFDRHLEVHEVKTMPTASIRYRAACVYEKLCEVAMTRRGPIHLVGHSTGGLDARLAIAPTASLPTDIHNPDVYDRVKSIVTVSTPHEGTPLASFFAGAMGKPLLKLMAASVAVMLDRGRLPVQVAVRLGEMMAASTGLLGLRAPALEHLYDRLLRDFPEKNREALIEILEEVATDASLIFQLTHEATDLFNAATAHPLNASFGCVVTRAPTPSIRSLRNHGADAYAQVMHILYRFLYFAVAKTDRYSKPKPSQAQPLRSAYGTIPNAEDNDGIVPTLSQLWGEVVCAVSSDHLDVIGHHGDSTDDGTDWIPSDSGFRHNDFLFVWNQVARFLMKSGTEN